MPSFMLFRIPSIKWEKSMKCLVFPRAERLLCTWLSLALLLVTNKDTVRVSDDLTAPAVPPTLLDFSWLYRVT